MRMQCCKLIRAAANMISNSPSLSGCWRTWTRHAASNSTSQENVSDHDNLFVQLRISLQHCKPIRSCTNRYSILRTYSKATNMFVTIATHSCSCEWVIRNSKRIRTPTNAFLTIMKSFVELRVGFQAWKPTRSSTNRLSQPCNPIRRATGNICGVHLAVCRHSSLYLYLAQTLMVWLA